MSINNTKLLASNFRDNQGRIRRGNAVFPIDVPLSFCSEKPIISSIFSTCNTCLDLKPRAGEVVSHVLGWELEVHYILLLDTWMNGIVAEGEGSPASIWGKCLRVLVPHWVSEIAGIA